MPSWDSKDELGDFWTLSEEFVKNLSIPVADVQAYRLETVCPGAGMGDVPVDGIIADM